MNKMIDWACNSDCLISFDKEPVVQVRVIKPYMTPLEKRSIQKYPFCCKKPLKVMIFDNKKFKQYDFEVKENYCYDGMTIPRFAWSLIGVSKEDNRGLIAALIHDYLTENKQIIDNDRALSTNVFNALLEAGNINPFKRFVMKSSVACYQTLFCKW